MLLKGLKNCLFILISFDDIHIDMINQKLYTETLIEAFPSSIELWIELLLNPEMSQNIPEVNF